MLAQSVGTGSAAAMPALPPDLTSLIATSQAAQPAAVPGGPGGPGPALDPMVNTSTHRSAHMRLTRFMESPEGAKFPHMQKLWSGNRDDPCLQDFTFFFGGEKKIPARCCFPFFK